MKKLTVLGALVIFLGMASCSSSAIKEADYDVIPLPKEIVSEKGEAFVLDKNVEIAYADGDAKLKSNAEFLASYIQEILGFTPALTTDLETSKAIKLTLGLDRGEEAYQLTVSNQGITINGSTAAGVFYGIQTLRKSLPIEVGSSVKLSPVVINDEPRFSYRGMMLDVSRHFFPVEFIKKYIDILALHNLNRFHWHLTEDQGWRIEIKKYPKLTEIGSKRSETVIGRNTKEYDGVPYGGFYTQEEAKEIVAYAAERYITVVPEIDMPGHMQAALAAYPELGCTGGPYEVWKRWGVSDNVLCVGNDKTLAFISGVLSEIIAIFPSKYIHVGGDECPKTKWKSCPRCQARIRKEGIKADHEHSAEDKLQSFAINYAEQFLNKHGRQIIGWDEILEGGLAPNATVMSWRGMKGGIQAAKMGHDVVMTPTSHAYFDYYQTKDTAEEPLAIGGYVPVKKVYELEPVDSSLTAEEAKFIIGAQANLWTEYIPTGEHAEYMVLPRLAALAEVQWCNPEQKDYDNFLKRLPNLLKLYDLEGFNYAKHLLDVEAQFSPNLEKGVLEVKLSTLDNAPIHYTLDGSDPTVDSPVFDRTLDIDKNTDLKAVVIRDNGNSRVFEDNVNFSKSSMKPIEMLQPINKQYYYEGATTLIDGLKGNNNYKTGRWIAFYGNDLEAVIDLNSVQKVSSVSLSTCVNKGDWVFDARGLSVFVSNDGIKYTLVGKESYPAMKKTDRNGIYEHQLDFEPVEAKFVKVLCETEQEIPSWHGGKGKKAFMFVDEITIN